MAAQEEAPDTALARSLFEQGMTSVDARDWGTAADQLARSLEIRDSPVVRVNYALVLVELGRLVEATEHLQRVLRASEAGTEVHELAATRLRELRGRLGQLQIDVTPAGAGAEVRIDGRRIPPAALGVAQPADPGRREVTVHRGGRVVARAEVVVESARLATVVLSAGADAGGDLVPFGVVLGTGLGVAAIATGLAIGFWTAANDTYAELHDTCAPACSPSVVDGSGVADQVTLTNVFLAVAVASAALAVAISIPLAVVGSGSSEARAELGLGAGNLTLTWRAP